MLAEFEDMEVVLTSNGITVGNFSSPKRITFVDGTVLNGAGDRRVFFGTCPQREEEVPLSDVPYKLVRKVYSKVSDAFVDMMDEAIAMYLDGDVDVVIVTYISMRTMESNNLLPDNPEKHPFRVPRRTKGVRDGGRVFLDKFDL